MAYKQALLKGLPVTESISERVFHIWMQHWQTKPCITRKHVRIPKQVRKSVVYMYDTDDEENDPEWIELLHDWTMFEREVYDWKYIAPDPIDLIEPPACRKRKVFRSKRKE